MPTPPTFAVLRAPAAWRTVDLISDLHLKPEEPDTFRAWSEYLQRTRADAVLILGDLFEAWVGDDAAEGDSFEIRCGAALDGCRADLAFMRGNRDFLIGASFLSRHHIRDLADPTLLLLGAQRLVLSHGDLLCTDDVAYQQFRRQVRRAEWQRDFLARPLAERQALARHMRAVSEQQHGGRPVEERAWADADLARKWLCAAGATTLIHGHTHQPADHDLGMDAAGRRLTQVVLSDWHIQGATRRAQVLRLESSGERIRLDPAEA